MKRCERSIHHIQAPVLYHLPLINAEEHPIAKLSADKLFVRLAKQHNYYMVSVFCSKDNIRPKIIRMNLDNLNLNIVK